MLENRLLKRNALSAEDVPANYLTGRPDDDANRRRIKAPPKMDPGPGDFVPAGAGAAESSGAGGGRGGVGPEPQGAQVGPFSNEPSTINNISGMIASPLANLPSYRRAIELRQKRLALETMPTYTNKKGETVQGLEDKDGRLQSGLKGLVAGLAQNFGQGGGARDWGDFYSRLSGSIARGAGGAVFPEWNEWSERSREIEKLRAQEEEAVAQAKTESQSMSAASTREKNERTADRLDKGLEARIARSKIQNLRDEQKMVLEPIFKRGYYYEGRNLEEDAALAKSNIILPDFDTTHKDIIDNGVRKRWDLAIDGYKPIEGTEVDPDDVPMDFMIDGQKVTASRKYFINYQAAKERQKSQHEFQAGQQEDRQQFQAGQQEDRQQFEARMKGISDENTARSQVVGAIKEGRQRMAEGKMTKKQFKAGINLMVGMFSEPIAAKLKAHLGQLLSDK